MFEKLEIFIIMVISNITLPIEYISASNEPPIKGTSGAINPIVPPKTKSPPNSLKPKSPILILISLI